MPRDPYIREKFTRATAGPLEVAGDNVETSTNADRTSQMMRVRLIHVAYLIAITTAMVGWAWLIFSGIKRLVS